jgi:hypothetical protein
MRQRILDRTVLTGPRYASPVPLYGEPCSSCSQPIAEPEPVVVVPDPEGAGASPDLRYLKLHRSCGVLAGVIP